MGDVTLIREWKKVSGSTLKMVGIITMLIDHLGLAIIARMMMTGQPQLSSVYSVMRSIGRLGFPIFCFLLVEGFDKTRSRAKYLFRLGIFALISEVPYDLAFSATVLEFNHQNVYFTLFLGLLSLCAYVSIEKHELPALVRWVMSTVGVVVSAAWMTRLSWHLAQRYILSNFPMLAIFGDTVSVAAIFCVICIFIVGLLLYCRRSMGADKMLNAGTNLAILFLVVILADLLHTDYRGMGVLTITAMYILRNYNVLAMAGGCVVLMFKGLNEIPAFWTLIPIAMYNGKRGLKLKYFFYVFYPAHLLLLWGVAWLMGKAFIPVF
ncbi:MAG: hypothetical protein J1F63_03705 [Oscillospiraceae bacterium]|nr:hypothetical protein [Oscillospiraceae bacterium]